MVHDFGHVVPDFQKEPAEPADRLLGAGDIILNGNAGDRVLGFEFWVLSFGFWVLSSGF